jgi:hypothetical protein
LSSTVPVFPEQRSPVNQAKRPGQTENGNCCTNFVLIVVATGNLQIRLKVRVELQNVCRQVDFRKPESYLIDILTYLLGKFGSNFEGFVVLGRNIGID